MGEKDGYPLLKISNNITIGTGLYVSTGIHGDEPAPPWALLEWFENGGLNDIAHLPVTLFPCLNPWGMVENRRSDAAGRDLNRMFDQTRISPIREVRTAVQGYSYQLALCLHEDYDARGIYSYDLNNQGHARDTAALLKRVTSKMLAVEPRKTIEGMRAKDGVIFRRKPNFDDLPGLPEAPYLFLTRIAERTITFETPSEHCLTERVQAHRRFLVGACSQLLTV